MLWFRGQPLHFISVVCIAQVSLEVDTLAYPVPSLQWYFEGVPVTGSTSRTLVIPRVQRSHLGSYICRAFNESGFADTEPLTIVLRNEAPLIVRASDDCEVGPAQTGYTRTSTHGIE